MAMTKTTEIEKIELRYMRENIHPEGVEILGPEIFVRKVTTWDDPDDDQLPMTKGVNEVYPRQKWNQETGAWEDNDISGADQIVQDIAAVVWA